MSNLRITEKKCIDWMPSELCNFDLTHDLDPEFFKVRFQIVVYHELLVN